MAEAAKKKKTLWNFVDTLEGDKVVWMIVILLIMVSILAIFSSTSQLALMDGTSRMAIVREQMALAVVGLGLIIGCCAIPKIGIFRILSQFGYIASIIPLLILLIASAVCGKSGKTSLDMGFITAQNINSAWRIIKVFGVQFHVYEFVKVAMIMYLSWAVNAYNNDSFTIANHLAKKYPIWKKPLTKKIAYIYFPIFSTCLCMMTGSLSSPVFIGGIMMATILVGGIKIRELLPVIGVAAVLLLGCIGINAFSKKKLFSHLDSALGRITDGTGKKMARLEEYTPNSKEFDEILGSLKQPIGAKVAIKEGKFLGKGAGKSTQRYVIPIVFDDYMFSFIVEEYGWLGGMILMSFYISLLARGSIIARNCDNQFAKTAVAGLVLLISGQALLHIVINCDMGPLTGQTLPMVSHGNSSFLMFSLAFGIILSISKMAKRKIEREAAREDPLVDRRIKDEVRSGIEDLEQMENDIPDYGIDDHNNE